MSKIERRTFDVGFEIRETEGMPPMIIGHAAVFNQTADLGAYKERVAPGAFTRAIKEDDVRALWNHNSTYVLGRNKAGTLQLEEDATGLAVRVSPPDTQFARDLMVSMKRGDVTQMSFGFVRRAHKIDQDANGYVTRTLLDCQLFDVSPVTYPAYTGTDVSVRNAESTLAELLEEIRLGPGAGKQDESWIWDLDLRAREVELVRNF